MTAFQIVPPIELSISAPQYYSYYSKMSSHRWTPLLLIVVMASSLAQTTTPASSTSDSSRDVTRDYGGRTGRDGKTLEPYWRPEFNPVNNIQIGGCCKPVPTNTTATDDLLNMTRTILDLLQNQEPRQVFDAGRPRDCSEVQSGGVQISGVYPIYPDGPGDPFFVYCDMETDGGGWTVFQRRQDGSVDFYLYWADYKYGFGSVSAEHWLGNDNIHRISTQKTYELRVDLEDFEGDTGYARYSSFSIASETSEYTLTIGNYSGNAGDSLTPNSAGRHFTTRDRDNDEVGSDNCAVSYTGAWWYGACHNSNLNGQYLNGTTDVFARGAVWKEWRGHYYSLKKTEMKIRPV